LKDKALELEQGDPENRWLAKEYPSERTISRIKATEWPGMSETEQAEYRTFYWPESMERGDLPWEASATALELMHRLDAAQSGLTERPPNRFVKWFWRVSQALPPVSEAPPGVLEDVRVLAAGLLTLKELGGEPVSMPMVEWWLAYRPWEGKEQERLYREATRRKEKPIPTWGAWKPWDPLATPWPSLVMRRVRVGGDVDVFQWVMSLFRLHLGFELPRRAEWTAGRSFWLDLLPKEEDIDG
jgi:hypothetical protein